MIKKFFQRLNDEGISYILISGQATVIYGAATFSEDIDLWIKPSFEDWDKFLKVVRELRGKVYKLTPPLRMDLIQKGHGFHFQFFDPSNSIWFLDVMGKVPRVGDFEAAFKNASYEDTDWGTLPVMGIRELVELKKTRRLSDYTVISNLVKIEYERLRPYLTPNDWKWVLSNSFEADDLLYFLKRSLKARQVAKLSSRKCLSCLLKAIEEKAKREAYIREASKQILMDIEDLRQRDIIYWKPIIAELKSLQRKGKLLPEGTYPPPRVSC